MRDAVSLVNDDEVRRLHLSLNAEDALNGGKGDRLKAVFTLESGAHDSWGGSTIALIGDGILLDQLLNVSERPDAAVGFLIVIS